MKVALWIIQLILAALYLMAGLWKIAGKAEAMQAMMPGVPLLCIRLVGAFEAVAACGLVLTKRMPAATVWAGAALAVEAVVFVIYHVSRGLYGPAAVTLVLGLLAGFVALKRRSPA